MLSLLGLLPRDFDLLSFYQQLYSEQIAGYYDDEVKAMFVVKNSGFTGVERDTYAHGIHPCPARRRLRLQRRIELHR